MFAVWLKRKLPVLAMFGALQGCSFMRVTAEHAYGVGNVLCIERLQLPGESDS